MDPNTATYTAMYDGRMLVVDPNYPDMDPTPFSEPTYYSGEILAAYCYLIVFSCNF